MMQLFVDGGLYMFPLLVLAVVILALTVKKALDLFVREGLERDQLERGLSAILFWGCVAASAGATSAPASVSIRAITEPTSTVVPSCTTISTNVPETGDGMSASTLSVDISRID